MSRRSNLYQTARMGRSSSTRGRTPPWHKTYRPTRSVTGCCIPPDRRPRHGRSFARSEIVVFARSLLVLRVFLFVQKRYVAVRLEPLAPFFATVDVNHDADKSNEKNDQGQRLGVLGF